MKKLSDCRVRLKLHATPEEVMRAVQTFQEFARQQGVTPRDAFELALALEESASNIVNHAYHRDSRHVFRVSFEHTASRVTLELRDNGPKFNPTLASSPASFAGADDHRPPGGWGIQLVRRYMDEIRYRREQGQNILVLTKRLALSTPGSGQD